MATLNMLGHIDSVFKSTDATRIRKVGDSYVDGKYVEGSETTSPHTVNIQPASDKQIDHLERGGERIKDARRVYVNDGDLYSISEADNWTFTGIDGVFKTQMLDNRPWRNYCRFIAVRIDDQ